MPYFWSLVEKSDGCWRWTGNFFTDGYGRVHCNGRRQAAHRVAYQLTVGSIEPGLFVCHHCDNKWCVRPDHLFVGTAKDNMQDWTKKGFNRLANDRSLWNMGRHWRDNDAAREKMSGRQKHAFATGKRVVIRGEGGRLLGTKAVE